MFKWLGYALAWEGGWWLWRIRQRHSFYARAQARALELGRPLVVVGAPDRGPTPGPGCGDVTIDIGHSKCPGYIQADITEQIPLPDDSAVVLVSYVLEYVADVELALAELLRVAGSSDNLFVLRVQPWTLTAFFYPGAARTLHVKGPYQLGGD